MRARGDTRRGNARSKGGGRGLVERWIRGFCTLDLSVGSKHSLANFRDGLGARQWIIGLKVALPSSVEEVGARVLKRARGASR